MNVLPLVFTILLVLVLFTNVQTESFNRFSIVKKEYKEYINEKARIAFNSRQEALMRSKKSNNPTKGKRNANARLCFSVIFDKNEREANDDLYKQHRFLLKSLMQILYSGSEFYQKIEEKRPQFLDELIDGMIAACESKKIKFVQDSYKLILPDSELQDVFYQMMTGIKKEEAKKTEIIDDDDDEDTPADPAVEFPKEKGWISLREFFHFNQNQKEIRVYLASKEVLMAIFGDEATANEIIQLREALFLKVASNAMDVGIANQKLEEFKSKKRAEIKDQLLDFTVTKTNPKNYR